MFSSSLFMSTVDTNYRYDVIAISMITLYIYIVIHIVVN
jgi:hypothetical protein